MIKIFNWDETSIVDYLYNLKQLKSRGVKLPFHFGFDADNYLGTGPR